jgi:mono/diheme cytochrome c family protein
MSVWIRRGVFAGGMVAVAGLVGAYSATAETVAVNAAPAPAASYAPMVTPADHKHMLMQYCTACHNDKLHTANMSVVPLNAEDLQHDDATWEKILRRLSLGEMPPKGMPRPPKEQINDFTKWLAGSLDSYADAHPNPGHATVRRMNRAEYANAVRDLLGLDVDFAKELPTDDTGYGFDNIADVLTVSPTLMDRYLNVAGKVARLATGQSSRKPNGVDYHPPRDLFVNAFGIPSYNERANDDLPLDSRGGASYHFYAPYDATYTIQVYLNAGTQTEAEIDANNRYELKVPMKAGPRVIGVSFAKTLGLEESLLPRTTNGPRQPKPTTVTQMPMNVQIDGVKVKSFSVPSVANGTNVAQAFFLRDVQQISVIGPYDIKGPGDTPSRRKIFVCRPAAAADEDACAQKIIATLARHAYRRPVTQADTAPLMKIYAGSRKGADFDHGIEAAVEAVLVSPSFLFMREEDPATAPSVHRISDLELATRLSFFLWSSIPDDQLLSVAEKKQLSKPEVLKAQVARMLADPRSKALVDNFAGQWLYLRRLEYQKPDRKAYPDFDRRLREAMMTESSMFFMGVIQENRSVLDFLQSDYTYLNQRLAEHYGVPGVYGTAFRKVQLDPALHRGGLLGQGAILTVTSYNNRTSTVLRGKWILDNILGAAPPPPPPNVPALNDAKNGKSMTVRQQMEAHRANPVCASCHTKMDPLGFSLENYDATGAWRTGYAGSLVDASAVMPDGTAFEGPKGLQGILLARKEQFVEAFTERLMTYALARGVEAYDMPAIRKVKYQAAPGGFKAQDIIMGIVTSVPFTMRKTPSQS